VSPKRVLLAASGAVALAVVVLAVSGYAWASSYAPIVEGNGSGQWGGVTVQPVVGSDGVPVFLPRYRRHGTFRVLVSFENDGHFAVTVHGVTLPDEAPIFLLTKVEAAPAPHGGFSLTHLRPVDAQHPFVIQPHEEDGIMLTFRIGMRCPNGQVHDLARYADSAGGEAVSRTLDLRISYADIFERTQPFTMPVALALSCRLPILPDRA
jgi:hypothetical protein